MHNWSKYTKKLAKFHVVSPNLWSEKYWKLLEFFSTRENSELKSVLYPWLVAEIGFTIKDLKDATTTSPFNSLIWPM